MNDTTSARLQSPSRNLATRLLLLVVVATAPALITLIHLQFELREQRMGQARSTALRQAEQVNSSIGNVTEGARQLMLAVARMRQVRNMDPRCRENIASLQTDLPQYLFLTVTDANAQVVCTSATGEPIPDALRPIVQQALKEKAFTIGNYSVDSTGAQQFLPMALPFNTASDGPGGVVVAALSLEWLGKLLADQTYPTNSSIVVSDRNGVALAHFPAVAGDIGRSFRPEGMAIVNKTTSGTAILPSFDGQERLVGYVPATLEPKGIFVSAGFVLSDFASDIDRVAWRGYRLIALGAVLSLLLALFVGQRVVRAPAAVLLDAARRWGKGDLAARAALPAGSASEFARLSDAFNTMAETLQIQRAELQTLNDALEARVSERTRALLESNNRLQVEIAEREMSESSLRQAQKLQAVGQLAGGMAHDFNNLLTAILGSLELLRSRVGENPKHLVLIDAAAHAVERGSGLTSRLLAFSRKQPLLSIPVDVAAVIGGMTDLLESTLGPSVRIETRIAPDLWPAMLDPHQFETAILNLALNGRDAMPAGGRLTIAANNQVVPPHLSEQDLPAGDYVSVVVVDSGTGMTDEVISRAFEPFFTTRTLREGAGLGLAQVHGMVVQSGGRIRIASRMGDGTRVTMLLQRSLELPATREKDLDRMAALLPPGAILLVDDDDAVREVTAAMLTTNGFDVLTAHDGSSGLAMLEDEGDRVQLVIADYMMPGMTGREFIDVVRQMRPRLAVLLATGYADFTAMVAGGIPMTGGLPADQIVRKPFRSAELLAKIQMVWERQSMQEEAPKTVA